MKTTETKKDNICWFCGHELPLASDMVSDKKPYPGAIAICIKCAAPGVFEEDLSIRKPTDEETAEILRSDGYAHYALAIAMKNAEEADKK